MRSEALMVFDAAENTVMKFWWL